MLRTVLDSTTCKLGFPSTNDEIVLRITSVCTWYLRSSQIYTNSLPRFYIDWPPRRSEVVFLLLKILSELGWTGERASLLQSGRLKIEKAKDRRNDMVYILDSDGRHLLTLYRNPGGFLAVSFHDDLGFYHSGLEAFSEVNVVRVIHQAVEIAANYLNWSEYIAVLAAIGKLPKEGEEEFCARNWRCYPLPNENKPGEAYWFPPTGEGRSPDSPAKRV